MEGLIFFVAMVVFIVRTVNKLKKTASANKKTAAPKTSPLKEHPFKDKLDDLVRSIEEAEKLKKEGHSSVSFTETDFFDEEFDNKSMSGAGESSQDFSDTVFSRVSSVKYDLKDDDSGDKPIQESEGVSAEEREIRDNLNESFNEQHEKYGIKTAGSSLSGFSASESVKNKKNSNILASLSGYPELQRAVVLKEIFDSPVSEKF